MPIEKRAAACRVDIPSSIAPTTRSRRSTLYGLPIDASDLCRGIESLFPSLGNPPDSLFRENALDVLPPLVLARGGGVMTPPAFGHLPTSWGGRAQEKAAQVGPLFLSLSGCRRQPRTAKAISSATVPPTPSSRAKMDWPLTRPNAMQESSSTMKSMANSTSLLNDW